MRGALAALCLPCEHKDEPSTHPAEEVSECGALPLTEAHTKEQRETVSSQICSLGSSPDLLLSQSGLQSGFHLHDFCCCL